MKSCVPVPVIRTRHFQDLFHTEMSFEKLPLLFKKERLISPTLFEKTKNLHFFARRPKCVSCIKNVLSLVVPGKKNFSRKPQFKNSQLL